MLIRDLALSDVEKLLEFELRNRAWFEQYVEPRDQSFYCSEGVRNHIRAYLAAKQQGRFHGCVITNDSEKIIARANLREINRERASAEVGYRVSKDHLGQGIASAATAFLIKLAYQSWQIKQLRGFVSVENLASARVLEKNGFVQVGLRARLATLHNRQIDCFEYLHIPDDSETLYQSFK